MSTLGLLEAILVIWEKHSVQNYSYLYPLLWRQCRVVDTTYYLLFLKYGYIK